MHNSLTVVYGEMSNICTLSTWSVTATHIHKCIWTNARQSRYLCLSVCLSVPLCDMCVCVHAHACMHAYISVCIFVSLCACVLASMRRVSVYVHGGVQETVSLLVTDLFPQFSLPLEIHNL